MKTLGACAIALLLLLSAAGCAAGQSASAATGASGSITSTTAQRSSVVASQPLTVIYSEEDLDATWTPSKATSITLNGSSVKVLGTGAVAQGGNVTITAGGVYVISGTLDDGQIVVDAKDKETVRLVLNGANIACSKSAPIYVKSAKKTMITLVDGTDNSVTDGDSYVLADEATDEPNAAIYCTSDLTINGGGSLTVEASYDNGITGKDELKIVSGDITVDAVNDAIRGRDCIGVKAGTLTLTAGGDGMQSNNDEDPERGFISIEDGTFVITAGNDGIQAETTLNIDGGGFTVVCGGGSASGRQHSESPGNFDTATEDATATSDSAKALKAGVIVAVNGGTVNADSADDTIHSGGSVTIDGGTVTLASGDDAIHADNNLEINGGEIDVTACYEGLEGGEITLNDGTIRIQASDDGINTVPGDDEAATSNQQRQGPAAESGDNTLYINGGYVAVDASGDGLDINGPIEMTGGTVVVNGPTSDGNGPLDYLGELKITGGYLVAAGSSGMAQAPSESSSQYSVMVNFEQSQAAGTLIHIESAEGQDILTFAPTKQYQSVVLCSADLQKDATYAVSLGGSSTGTAKDSLYSGGTYTGGTEYTTLTIASMVTTAGTTRGGGPGGAQGGAPPGR